MIKVNIFTLTEGRNEFIQQLDTKRFPEDEFYIKENSLEDIIWDLVVVYEGVKLPVVLKYKKGGLIFISGEPPMSRVYPQAFLNQFDTLITQHPQLHHSDNRQYQPCLNWLLSLDNAENRYLYTYDDLAKMQPVQKSKNISMITSSKKMMPGHNKRMKFVNKLRGEFVGKIDFFGRGIKFVNIKTEAMLDYRFAISIENSNIPNYWTEKFSDPILAYAVPIYFGCKNISDYFPSGSYINIDITDTEKSINVITDILNNPEEIYEKHLPALIEARNKILNEYNIFPVLEELFGRQMRNPEEEILKTIYPAPFFKLYKVLLIKLRLKRLMHKLYINYLHY